ncbi:hypothetical protein BWQ96_00178 [Gracilariopsis chorda]|uniref:Uncharacterized protein n=1 Tax=Gracilariopsis chorda TaxID=448386 RepID=A0A2V3J6G8_9FLOR|nr:hypothetical protein BWQ96_00178 [Gracilariopsis chorda]|eukprot:PXF50018.1 hypothetical protein BWQ96_00178 [Gracilariopsis chorda]
MSSDTDHPPLHSAADQKQALNRFSQEAISFLSRAYPDEQHDHLVQIDRKRLQRFHNHAVSFLQRAYADNATTATAPVRNEHQPRRANSANSPHSPTPPPDAQLLQQFHHEAMSIAAAAQDGAQRHSSSPPSANPPDATVLRIARDKERLEQHYQDAMSFLNRTERGGDLVEEHELEGAAVDRLQLQLYAKEAMLFLDNAFRDDASDMVDEEKISPQRQQQILHRIQQQAEEKRRQEEERQIAEDRARLQRYEYEYDRFLSQAYQDDSAVIVDDADSETTSTSERGLYSRRIAPSTPSAETASYTESAATHDDEFSDEDAHTDDEFQDPSTAEPPRFPPRNYSVYSNAEQVYAHDSEADLQFDEQEDAENNVHEQMVRYEREAADYLEGANVSDEEDARFDAQVAALEARQRDSSDARRDLPQRTDSVQDDHHDDHHDDQDMFGADCQIEEEKQISLQELPLKSAERQSSSSDLEAPSTKFPDRVEETVLRDTASNEPSPSRPRLVSNNSKDLLVDVILEDKAGKSQQWSDVALDRTFYRQVPRGSTIKLRPRLSPELSRAARSGSVHSSGGAMVSFSELQRVEKERDTALATLEEIVNERSMLAAQVGQMKSMMSSTGTDGKHRDFWEDDGDASQESDIDLRAELREAHSTMEQLTEEMETTLSVLDARYRETLSRAHKAEERCIRLESNVSMLENEFASQGIRMSRAMAEEQRLSSLLKRKDHELETLRRKSEKDLQKIDEAYREESDARMQRIRELSGDVTLLQDKLKAATAKSDRRIGSSSASRRLELEVLSLKRRLGDNERKLSEERLNGRRKMETELKRMQNEHDEEVRRLVGKVDRLENQVGQMDELKRDTENLKSERDRLQVTITAFEGKVLDVTKELKEAKREQIAAEAEAKHVRARYEESLKKKLVEMDHCGELAELQHALQGLRNEAAAREKKLKKQLEEFRGRAEQAEAAAASAERDAKEAAEAVKTVQEKGQQALESERKMRQAIEAEKKAAEMESKAWEKLAQQQMEQSAVEVEVVKSSSRRGLRKSPSKGRDSTKKRDKGGRSDEAGRKKSTHRPRLFG